MDNYHSPVLVDEVIEGLNIRSGKKYIDATLGGGGHAVEVVKRGGIVLGIDMDPDAIEHAGAELRTQCPELREGKEWVVVQGNFRDIERIAKENGFENVEGILFDLGVSSHQLDSVSRGFSYRFPEAPLDLRMNPEVGESGADIINKRSVEELFEILSEFGEEEKAFEIAKALKKAKPIRYVGDVVTAITSVILNKNEQVRVLSRVFQALRIVVNDELGALAAGLVGASALLAKEGRLAVISFHSLEDRKVKLFMQGNQWRLITKKPIVAGLAEVRENPRSRSAKLRIAEKV